MCSYGKAWLFFFFSSRRRHTRWNCDWSSDVCSSDLRRRARARGNPRLAAEPQGRGDPGTVRRQRQPQECGGSAGRAGARWRSGGRRVARSRRLGRACADRRRLGNISSDMYTVLKIILLFDALILTTAVLLQAGQGGGLASLGGGAGTETIMGGRQATTLLTKVTWWTAGIFLFLALVLTFMSQQGTQARSVLEGQVQPPAPVQPTPLPIENMPPTKTPPPSNR